MANTIINQIQNSGLKEPEDLSLFGKVILDLSDEMVAMDGDLQEILGWEKIPTDDLNSRWEVAGITSHGEEFLLVLSWEEDMDRGMREYWGSYPLSGKEYPAIREWMAKKNKVLNEKEEKRRRIRELLREHRLDDESVKKRREALLWEHGLT